MSEIRANTVSNAAGTGPVTLTGQSASKNWVNCTQDGTQAIVDSFNTSSITDAGVGITTVNLTSGMANATYPSFLSGWDSSFFLAISVGSDTTSSNYTLRSGNTSSSYVDANNVFGVSFGDLA